MKRPILLLIGLLLYGGVYAQHKVDDFCSMMMSATLDKKIHIIDVIYQDGAFDSLNERTVKSHQSKRKNKIYDEIGAVIDEAQLIDYTLDTLYILSTYYMPAGSESTTIKTGKGAFDMVHTANGEYTLRSLEDSYINRPKDEKESDFLLYKTIFAWDVDLLVRLIKSSGGNYGSEYWMSATRIIIKDHQVLRKDNINFKPTVRWHL